jgi:hypothetical protein
MRRHSKSEIGFPWHEFPTSVAVSEDVTLLKIVTILSEQFRIPEKSSVANK